MKELDADTSALLKTLAAEWKKYGCGSPDVFWLHGNEADAKAWHDKHKLNVRLAVIPADSKTLAPWRLDAGAHNTLVAIGDYRIRAVVRNATTAGVATQLKQALADTNTPERIVQRLTSPDKTTRIFGTNDVRNAAKGNAALLASHLERLSAGPNEELRTVAVRALGLLTAASDHAVPALLKRLEDGTTKVRIGAASALRNHRTQQDVVLRALTTRLTTEPEADVRAQLLTTLGSTTRCRAAKALPALLVGLQDEAPTVRSAAIQGIQRLYGPERPRGD